jgi:hypothetical protein
MSPLDRLLAEAVPTGTFGDARTATSSAKPRRWTPAEQAAHLRELAAAIGAPHLRTAA